MPWRVEPDRNATPTSIFLRFESTQQPGDELDFLGSFGSFGQAARCVDDIGKQHTTALNRQ